MFERRIKIFLAILILFTGVLVARAFQLQVIEHKQWNDWAIKNVLSTRELIQTTRGRLLDRKGRPIADNQACIDACVDFRAIVEPPDEKWVRDIASGRIKRRPDAGTYRDSTERARLLAEEIARVELDIKVMWTTLARLGNLTDDQIHDLRRSIVDDVRMKQRSIWIRSYELDVKKWEKQQKEAPPSAWYQRWLGDDSDQMPELDKYKIDVREQFQPHAILKAIDNEKNNWLGKNQDRFPGLVLQPGIHRYYPYLDGAAHIIGHLSSVSADDLKDNSKEEDDLKRYWRTDLIGRAGLEAICEPLLRGVRGRKRYLGGETTVIEDTPPVPGMDVKTTIDIDLQQDIQHAFTHVELPYGKSNDPPELKGYDKVSMLGAAVVLDIASGEVLAMASAPSYDLNTLDDDYPTLAADQIKRALTNRATQFALEPGSTVKPMVGLGAITQGIFNANDTIECTGYLVLDGRTYKNQARCWVASMFSGELDGAVSHHPVPSRAPHPTGFLTFDDALERSCNVFFETLADRLGTDGLRYWYKQFGLGQPTGIGIPETSGRIPGDVPVLAALRRSSTWFSGIGQSQVLATPIQMANVAATIARDGILMRPHLVPTGTEIVRPKIQVPDRVDLHLSPAALQKAHEGMFRVVNSAGGTGTSIHRDDINIAAKTGTAQAAPLMVRIKNTDEYGRPIMKTKKVMQTDASGKITFVEREVPVETTVPIALGTHEHPTPEALWYRGIGDNQDKRAHSWVIGFAPVEKPKIAFAVFVEYGGSGGVAAGYVVKEMLAACIEHGYLEKK